MDKNIKNLYSMFMAARRNGKNFPLSKTGMKRKSGIPPTPFEKGGEKQIKTSGTALNVMLKTIKNKAKEKYNTLNNKR